MRSMWRSAIVTSAWNRTSVVCVADDGSVDERDGPVAHGRQSRGSCVTTSTAQPLAIEAAEQFKHLRRRAGVEVARGLVGQQQGRLA
jgi:hypothetical protein